jgi:hypothetical protein
MMPKVIVRTNAKTSQISVEVDGVEGASCVDITAAFEAAMGIETQSQKKREFYTQNETQQFN